MKNRILTALVTLILFCTQDTKSQIVLFENFSNGMPSNFTIINNDGLTPDQAVSFVNNAWVIRQGTEVASDSVALSTSWYAPSGRSDDWMITPLVSIGTNAVLSWKGLSPDVDFRDGYQVLISNTGTSISDFTDTIFSVAAENASWTSRSIDLWTLGYANIDVYIAFRNNSIDKFILLVDDIKLKNLTPTDVQMDYVQIPDISCDLTNAEDVVVGFTNVGTNAVTSIPFSYTVNGGTLVTETFTGTLQPGESGIFTFTQQADFSAKNTTFNIVAYSSAAGDGDLTNDTSATEITVNVASADILANGYTTSFENFNQIVGWKAEDSNNDLNTWSVFTGQTNTGDFSYLYLFDETNAANDWLFSTCLDLVANQPYRLDFFHKTGSTTANPFPEKFLVSYGLSSNSVAMTNLLKDFGTVSNEEFEHNALGFIPSADNTYYIGFKTYSDADQFYLSIDDVSVAELLPPTAIFNSNTNGLDAAFSSPNGDDPINGLSWDFGDGSTLGEGGGLLHNYNNEGTYYVCLTVTNVGGNDTYCDSVTVALDETGIKNLLANNMKLYPNPTSGKVTIELPTSGEATFQIVNTLGAVVYAETKNGATQYQLDLSSLNNGMYFITTKQSGLVAQNKITIAQ